MNRRQKWLRACSWLVRSVYFCVILLVRDYFTSPLRWIYLPEPPLSSSSLLILLDTSVLFLLHIFLEIQRLLQAWFFCFMGVVGSKNPTSVMSSNIYQIFLEPSWKNSFQEGISVVRLEFGQQRTHVSLLIFSEITPVKRWPLKLFYIKVKVRSVTLWHWLNATGGLYVQWIITIYPKSTVFHEADRGQCHFCFVLVQL